MAYKLPHRVQHLFSGWRIGLAWCTFVTAVAAIVNVLFLGIVGSRLKAFDADRASDELAMEGALVEGSCEKAKEVSVWLHLGINIFSSALLASSNYAQQMLTAPSRREVDRAHERHTWLNIGILSYRNLGAIPAHRVLAWAVLVLSSVPIHLMYNAVVSLETSTYDYLVTAIPVNETTLLPDGFERLENAECIREYSRQFVTDRSDVYLVVDSNYTYWILDQYASSPYKPKAASEDGWMCAGNYDNCDQKPLLSQPDEWSVLTRAVDDVRETPRIHHCLSKPEEETCRLAMNLDLMYAVVGCNVLKLLGLALTWVLLDTQPLLTLGDAVASFLQFPDPMTARGHILNVGAFRKTTEWQLAPTPWRKLRRRWAHFISPWMYAITMLSSLAIMIASSVFLKKGISQITVDVAPSMTELWNRGFGKVDVDCMAMFSGGTSPTAASLLSNIPQLIISVIYTTINGIWTSMMVGKEWNGYGQRRKGLRTTNPTGQQRRSYWLSLPFRYGWPLITASTLLHWLVSQSLFPVRILLWQEDRVIRVTAAPGFSPIAIIFAMLCWGTIVLATVGLTLVPFETATPQIGTCSAVLSAACHPSEGEEYDALGKVQWGVIFTGDGKQERCSITSRAVKAPIEGVSY